MKLQPVLPFVLLVLISIIALWDLLHPGLPLTHDGQDHVARIANFYQNLAEGTIVPRWAMNLNWGYGHPILMFLYPMSSYLASLFHFLGFSLVDSTKLVFAFGFILSGIGMYLWLKEFLDRQAAWVGALLYLFAPYRFVDLYVRGAIGEHVAFVFPPFILYFLLKLSKKYSTGNFVGGSICFAGLILSHNAISLMFLPIIVFYLIFLLIQTKSLKIVYFGPLSGILGFGLSAFFWIPALLEGKFTLRDVVTKFEITSRFVDFQNFLYSPWSYGGTGQLSVQIGILHWAFLISSIIATIYLFRKKNKLWIFCVGLIVFFVITLFLMVPYSQFIWQKISLLQKFQFPWRFLSVSVFTAAVLGAIVMYVIPKKIKLYGVVIATIVLLFLNKDYWYPKGFLQKPESFYQGIYYGTTDTGESAPIWSVRFMEKAPKSPIEIIDGGKGSIQQIIRKSTYHKYEIKASRKVRIRENTLFFPGWKIMVDGKAVDIQFQDPRNRGLMTFYVPPGTHTIESIFRETKLRLASNILSLISLAVIFGLVILSTTNRRKQ